MKRPKSKCCGADAKLDLTSTTPKHFCTKCVKTCELAVEQRKGSTLTTKRKPTGERALMIELYQLQDGKCAICKRPLWPPEHPMFHHQGSHILPKGTYPDERLTLENMIMIRKVYHDLWEAEKDKDKLVRIEPRFAPHVETYKRLYREAQQNNRPWEQAKRTLSE